MQKLRQASASLGAERRRKPALSVVESDLRLSFAKRRGTSLPAHKEKVASALPKNRPVFEN
jgi:hypothetical protein